jgi:hypothetical protein
MSRTTITTDGTICFRTKNLPLSIAANFARCIEANKTRFCDVAITPAKTKEEKYFVQFRPVSADRQGAMYEAQYNARIERAQAEGMDYIFWQDPDFPNSHWCFNPTSGETYQVTPFSCTCADYTYRCDRAGLKCKHQQAFQLQADAGRLGKTDKVTRTDDDRAAFDAKMRRMADLDF